MYRPRRHRILKKANKVSIEQQLRKSKNQKKFLARKLTAAASVKTKIRTKEKWQMQMEDAEGDQDLAS